MVKLQKIWGVILTLSLMVCGASSVYANNPAGTDKVGKGGDERRMVTGEHAVTFPECAFLVRTALEEVPSGGHPSEAVLSYLRQVVTIGSRSEDLYDRALLARVKAEAARALASNHAVSKKWADEVDNDLKFLDSWLDSYGQKEMVHRRPEPCWINGQPEVVAQAIIAWTTLERLYPNSERRHKIAKFGEGLCTLLSQDTEKYPFGAHISRMTTKGKMRNYKLPDSEEMVAGVSIIVERQVCVSALARAGRLLNNKDFIASACAEGTGLMAHLALQDTIPYDYAPRPEYELESPLSAITVVENLADLYEATGNTLYGDLAGCAAINTEGYCSGAVQRAVRSWAHHLLARIGYANWIGAVDLQPTNNGKLFELENGKAVEKSFNTHDIAYPGGTPGKLAVVGRDNMFWMRFDVDSEDSYFFHLCFLKRDASGGLVAVQMRIDGDNIFEVSLDGATEDPFVDAELVAGPRHLRQGPHSFGIRFSGLLMRSPAWLDAMMVEPAVQRRWVRLTNGETMLILNSIANKPIKMRIEELEDDNISPRWHLCTSEGKTLEPQLSKDRRKRVWLEMPARAFGKVVFPQGFAGLVNEVSPMAGHSSSAGM